MNLKSTDTLKEKLKETVVKLSRYSHEYSWYISLAILIMIYIQRPELREVYHIMIGVTIVALVVFTIIFCPLFVLIAILAPMLWISEKLQGKHSEIQE